MPGRIGGGVCEVGKEKEGGESSKRLRNGTNTKRVCNNA